MNLAKWICNWFCVEGYPAELSGSLQNFCELTGVPRGDVEFSHMRLWAALAAARAALDDDDDTTCHAARDCAASVNNVLARPEFRDKFPGLSVVIPEAPQGAAAHECGDDHANDD